MTAAIRHRLLFIRIVVKSGILFAALSVCKSAQVSGGVE
jgi:hypothetical protein